MTKGIMYVVATPIGNLEDITLRALNVLKESDLIACEDTRHSSILLSKYDIKTHAVSYFEINKAKADRKIDYLLKELLSGKNIALITDAGTPGISDPGQYLIQKAVEKDIEVVPVPGPSAFIAALSVSGFNDPSYFFIPFLPKKKGRQTMLNFIKEFKSTIVFYESPQRIHKTLEELVTYIGERRKVVVCRELTKQFEELFRGELSEATSYFSAKEKQRGEFVVVIKGYEKNNKG